MKEYDLLKKIYMYILPVFLCGCIGDPIYSPVKLTSPPNTFGLPRGIKWSADYVYSVDVENRHESLWHIVATEKVPAKGFIVTVGKTPKGFRQVIPASGSKFHPIKGNEYGIIIETHHLAEAHWWLGTTWTAD